MDIKDSKKRRRVEQLEQKILKEVIKKDESGNMGILLRKSIESRIEGMSDTIIKAHYREQKVHQGKYSIDHNPEEDYRKGKIIVEVDYGTNMIMVETNQGVLGKKIMGIGEKNSVKKVFIFHR